MLPKEPAKRPQLGFLYVPPFRLEGLSIAGEETAVYVPELDVCFDVGLCPKAILPAPYIALSHGHMDHVAGIAYYFSQRPFQGMTPGTVLCHPELEKPLHNLMAAWVEIERQRTKYNVRAIAPGERFEVKNNHFLEAFETIHTVPALGYTVVEKRTRLKDEFQGLPQEKIVEHKQAGRDIVDTFHIPLVTFTGDTAWGDHLLQPNIVQSKVIIAECTFMEPGHRKRAGVGKHLHLDHILDLLEASSEDTHVVLIHLSRRTHMGQVRKTLERHVPDRFRHRLLTLMDGRANRERYEHQLAEAEAAQAVQSGGK
ncbi:MAG: MBL fold metallo-hydrolase [Planctomycetota bacterium]